MNPMNNEVENIVEVVVKEKPGIAVITTNEQAEDVTAYLRKVREARKKIKEFFRPSIEKAHELHKGLLGQEKAFDERPKYLEEQFKIVLTKWQLSERDRVMREQEAMAKKISESSSSAPEVMLCEKPVEEAKKIEGVGLRQIWCAEVEDIKALCKAVASGKCPEEYVMPNLSALNSVMRATNGQIQIPGVKADSKSSTVVR